MTLKFNRVLEVVEVYVHAKMSLSWVQRFMSYRGHREKKTQTKTIQSVATARTVTR